MNQQIIKHWRIYLMALGKVKMYGAKVKAPRIGVCANNIIMQRQSWINANFRGCAPDSGRGNAARRISSCSGAGGAHAGKGGIGASLVSTDYYKDKCS